MSPARARISMIAAIDRNRLIGVDGLRMPWHLPDDLRHFRRLTTGKPVIMGRRTFESIGRPLPQRMNIVLTRNHSIKAIEGVLQTAADPDQARVLAAQWLQNNPPASGDSPEVMVIGGAQIYALLLDQADRLYLTEIDAEYDGTEHFPAFRALQPGWAEVERDDCPAGSGGEPAYSFVTYDRQW